jgi:3-hydroxybutyryl-CoA dehydrogenase
MGAGIAYVCASAGLDVHLRDVEDEYVRAGMSRIRSAVEKGVERGKISKEQAGQILGRIRPSTDLGAAVRDADLVLEAVPERLELKRTVFRDVDALAPARALLASNTSSISIAEIAAATSRPQNVLGLHFFNPPHAMKLVEIVHHPGTDPARKGDAVAFVHALAKEPILVRDFPGFATSRLGVALGLEAIRMVEAGVASVEDIDKAMVLGYGHPMGPLRLTDLVGLDVRMAIAEYLSATLGPRFEPPALLREKVSRGEVGEKAGRGFYDWPKA